MYHLVGLNRAPLNEREPQIVRPIGKRCSFERALKLANELRDEFEATFVFDNNNELVVSVNAAETGLDADGARWFINPTER